MWCMCTTRILGIGNHHSGPWIWSRRKWSWLRWIIWSARRRLGVGNHSWTWTLRLQARKAGRRRGKISTFFDVSCKSSTSRRIGKASWRREFSLSRRNCFNWTWWAGRHGSRWCKRLGFGYWNGYRNLRQGWGWRKSRWWREIQPCRIGWGYFGVSSSLRTGIKIRPFVSILRSQARIGRW